MTTARRPRRNAASCQFIYNYQFTADNQLVRRAIMERKASAVWKGGLKDGKGEFSGTSGVFSHVPYSFTTRFEGTPGTNPEELIAAAHASCFSMALSAQLGTANLTPESINTTANLKIEKLDAGWAITTVHL